LIPFRQRQWVAAWDQQQTLVSPQRNEVNDIHGFRLQDPEGFLYSNQILSALFAALTDPDP
ncbi:MAG: coproporphyrinogen III oxidase, partial [Synechocystis sp.]